MDVRALKLPSFQLKTSSFLKNHEKIYKPDFVLKKVPVIYLRLTLLQDFS